jgi:hypothetical protein
MLSEIEPIKTNLPFNFLKALKIISFNVRTTRPVFRCIVEDGGTSVMETTFLGVIFLGVILATPVVPAAQRPPGGICDRLSTGHVSSFSDEIVRVIPQHSPTDGVGIYFFVITGFEVDVCAYYRGSGIFRIVGFSEQFDDI